MMSPLKSARVAALLFIRNSIWTRRTWLVVGLVLIDLLIAVTWRIKGVDDVEGNVVDLARNVIIGFIIPFVALFYGTAVIRDEVENGTISYLFTRPISRASFVIGRSFCAFIVVALAGLIMTLANPIILAGSFNPQSLIPIIAAVIISSFAYTPLFTLIGAFFRRPFLIGLMLLLFFDFTVSEVPMSARFVTIKAHAMNIGQLNDDSVLVASEELRVLWSIFALIATGLVMLAASVAVVDRREYTTTD